MYLIESFESFPRGIEIVKIITLTIEAKIMIKKIDLRFELSFFLVLKLTKVLKVYSVFIDIQKL